MPQVAGVRRKGRSVHVDFDDGSSLHCDRDFLPGRRLAPGQTIEPLILERLRQQAVRHDAERNVLHWLANKPRSRADLTRRLRAKGVSGEIARETLDGLAAQGFLDDAAFARAWVESRLRSRPRSRALIRSELRAQGVDATVIADATTEIDDQALAETIAASQVGRHRGRHPRATRPRGAVLVGDIGGGDAGTDDDGPAKDAATQAWEAFRQRTGALLTRRGFSAAVAERALRSAWAECEASSQPHAQPIAGAAMAAAAGRNANR